MKRLRIIFAGTPEFASEHLQAVLESKHDLIAVYTQPDRPAGRGQKLTPSPVKALALAHDIPVFQPPTLKKEAYQAQMSELKADLMVVVAYGLILPQAVLDIPKYGCINVHGSILPRWRGAAPIQRAIGANDKVSGITIMQMDAGLDTGDMLIKSRCPVHKDDTASTLHDRLISLGKPALKEALDRIAEGTLKPEQQNDAQACYAHKLSKEEARLDWKKTTKELECHIRAFNPWPVATTRLDNRVIKLWQGHALPESTDALPGTLLKASKEGLDVACKDGILRLTHLQLPSSRAMAVQDILNSRKALFAPGKQFS